jgi:hypothetical protein
VEAIVAAGTAAVLPGAGGVLWQAVTGGTRGLSGPAAGTVAGAVTRGAYSIPPENDGPFGRISVPIGSLLPKASDPSCK